ncbi:hypothetical protein Y017_11380 [Alcanivorax sp. 97CO-5]|uniref:hypothetical protein n=1 Tax=unclassified Alcanivorax TaxID=2638842 RepID=UPI0003E7E25E|nr:MULTISPECIES: hypothetical protein [unclassified Alcanivorax]EUC70212.1 hypothetical protein Y017_11380 [Alcanivorax sp. 97CO-5]PKG01798.1 hypothetical protein Y019_06275 [Alcanivorax sp. 97CO-6]
MGVGENFVLDGDFVERIRASYPLDDRKPIDCGSTTEIYDGGDTIYRLASDGASHTFVIRAGSEGLAVPKCLNDWGRLKSDGDEAGEDDLWLAEFEKLVPLSVSPMLESEVKAWIKAVLDLAEVDDGLIIERDELERVRLAIPKCETPTSLSLVAETMVFMCEQCLKEGADLDFNETNLMMRPSTGEVLVTDPAHGYG